MMGRDARIGWRRFGHVETFWSCRDVLAKRLYEKNAEQEKEAGQREE